MKELVYGIVGTGAIGGFYGGILADSGKDVNFLLHSDYEYVKDKGLTIDSDVFGKINIKKSFFKSSLEMPLCDVVLVGLKTTQNEKLAELLKPILKKETLVILIQNGVGMEEDLQVIYPSISIAGGIAFIGVSKYRAGIITHQQLGDLAIGAYNEENTFLKQVIKEFNNTGKIKCTECNLQEERWKKLMSNITFSGLSVVLNTRMDLIVREGYSRELAFQIMEEVKLGAEACGIKLPENIISEIIKKTENMAPYSPSMKLDFDKGRIMELKYIYERPVEIALKSGYYMSKVHMLSNLLHFLEDQRK